MAGNQGESGRIITETGIAIAGPAAKEDHIRNRLTGLGLNGLMPHSAPVRLLGELEVSVL